MSKQITGWFFFICFSMASWAQVNDAGMWLSVNAEKKITPVLSFTLSEEVRLSENFTEAGMIFTDAGLNYKINKFVRVSANYRFIEKLKKNNTYNLRNRYYFDVTLRKKIKPVILQFRTRFQCQYNRMYEADDYPGPYYYSRNKFMVKADLDKNYVPYIYSEIYSPLNNPDGIFMDKIKYCAGIEYRINRMHEFDLFYVIQKEYNVENPVTDFVIGIGYNFTF
ncbi:MAG: DUF2490 domain-containing protein [Bacteroidia bacterium]|nr:DUF2490 domain-containing protein [Bacteroidia bacterium]